MASLVQRIARNLSWLAAGKMVMPSAVLAVVLHILLHSDVLIANGLGVVHQSLGLNGPARVAAVVYSASVGNPTIAGWPGWAEEVL